MKHITRIILLAFVVVSTSCAVNPLFRPDNGSMITWVGTEYIYTGTYAEPKIDSIVNNWGAMYCVGDIVFKEY